MKHLKKFNEELGGEIPKKRKYNLGNTDRTEVGKYVGKYASVKVEHTKYNDGQAAKTKGNTLDFVIDRGEGFYNWSIAESNPTMEVGEEVFEELKQAVIEFNAKIESISNKYE